METFHQRLTALDASFLGIETTTAHMHVGAVMVFDAEPLRNDSGGVAADKLRDYLEAILHHMPRYRQRLEWVPGLRHPVWIDDDDFNLDYHVRHAALPRPGDERTLKRLAGRIFSQKLDRTRPLWELWVVEGLEGDRFAIIPKVHHCMIDGIAGVDLMAVLLRGTTDASVPASKPWTPRPPTPRARLLATEVEHRVRGSRDAFERTRARMHDLGDWLRDARATTEGLVTTLARGLRPASPTPLNPRKIGPHRRFDVVEMDLARIKRVKDHFDVKVNDVVLAVATGGLARFFERRGLDTTTLRDFRAMVPVNVRTTDERGAGGNRVALVLASLPIAEPDPIARLREVRETTAYLKQESRQAESAQLIERISDFTSTALLRDVLRLANYQRSYNVVITNVPGPPFPLYLLGARMRSIYPLVPLFQNQALGIALCSYAGRLYWGLSADWERVPDLHELADDLVQSFEQLAGAVDTTPPASAS